MSARWWPLLLVAACVPQGTRYGLTKHPWWEARTAHFSVRTNIDREAVPELSRRLEQTWSALDSRYERIVPARSPADPMRVIHLERCSDVKVLADAAGGITSRTRDYLNETILVTCDDAWAPEGREAVIHELTHAFNRRFLGATPTWLNEGMAEYYSTIAMEDGKVVVGKLRVRDARLWGVVRRIPRLDELVRRRWTETEDRFTPLLAYFAARNLVHLLSNGPDEYRARFRRYLTLGANGLPWDDAWQMAFRDVADRLAADYRDYAFREARQIRDACEVTAAAAPDVQALRPGEVHATWIQLLLVGRYTADAAPYHLQEAEREDPTWPDLLFWKALLLHRAGKLGEAAELFRRHLGTEPDDRRALNGLVLVELERLTHDRLGLEPAPPPGIERLLDDVKALARGATGPEELNLVAWYFALAGKGEVGLTFARRALALKPSCADCLDTLALSLHQVGRDQEALEVQERAVRLDAGGNVKARKRLEAYRQAAGR